MQSMGGVHRETIDHALVDADHCVVQTYRGWCDNQPIITDDLPFDLTALSSLPGKGIRVGLIVHAPQNSRR